MEADTLASRFASVFGRPASVLTRAPGRLEVLGNHTDYNEGCVLSCAVERATVCAMAFSGTRRATVHDVRDGTTIAFELEAIGPPVPRDWGNYVRGVVLALQRRGHALRGFDAAIHTTLPLASGMSSSAALEISLALALGALHDIELPDTEWARIGRSAESDYLGANTGLLDQLTSLRGRAGRLVHTDFRTLEGTTHPLPESLAFVVANSGVTHDLTGEYNERRRACETVARALGVPFLRDVDSERLEEVRLRLPETTWRRARHVVTENERVRTAVAALAAGDALALGRLMSASHASSRTDFENSCAELDALVDLGRALPGFRGARLSGGGFGGITLHLVEASHAAAYATALAAAHLERHGRSIDAWIARAGDGARVLRGG